MDVLRKELRDGGWARRRGELRGAISVSITTTVAYTSTYMYVCMYVCMHVCFQVCSSAAARIVTEQGRSLSVSSYQHIVTTSRILNTEMNSVTRSLQFERGVEPGITIRIIATTTGQRHIGHKLEKAEAS